VPTALRVAGFEVMIYTHDHEPAHVHVFNADGEAIIEIATGAVRKLVGMKTKDESRARQIVLENRDFLADEWDRIKPIP